MQCCPHYCNHVILVLGSKVIIFIYEILRLIVIAAMNTSIRTSLIQAKMDQPNRQAATVMNPPDQLPYPAGLFRHALRLPLWLYRLGLGSMLNVVHIMVLTTRGRKSGQPRHTAIEYRTHGRKIYVVSAWGQRPQWFQNLVADPVVTLRQGGQKLTARATVVLDEAEALRVLYLFRKTAPAIYDPVLARVSSEQTVNGKVLPRISGQFTIVRFDPIQNAQGPETVSADLRGLLGGALVAGSGLLLISLVGSARRSKKRHE